MTPDVNRGGRHQIRLAGEKGGPTRMEKGSHQKSMLLAAKWFLPRALPIDDARPIRGVGVGW